MARKPSQSKLGVKAMGGGENDRFGAPPFYLYAKNAPKWFWAVGLVGWTARMGATKQSSDWSVQINGPHGFLGARGMVFKIIQIVGLADRSDGPHRFVCARGNGYEMVRAVGSAGRSNGPRRFINAWGNGYEMVRALWWAGPYQRAPRFYKCAGHRL